MDNGNGFPGAEDERNPDPPNRHNNTKDRAENTLCAVVPFSLRQSLFSDFLLSLLERVKILRCV